LPRSDRLSFFEMGGFESTSDTGAHLDNTISQDTADVFAIDRDAAHLDFTEDNGGRRHFKGPCCSSPTCGHPATTRGEQLGREEKYGQYK